MKANFLPLGLALIIIGGILTIGFIGFGPPLVLAGILFVLMDRLAFRPSRVLPILIGALAGLIGWYCLLPLGCTTSAGLVGGSVVENTSCSTILGVPGLGGLGAAIVGFVVGIGVWALAKRHIEVASPR